VLDGPARVTDLTGQLIIARSAKRAVLDRCRPDLDVPVTPVGEIVLIDPRARSVLQVSLEPRRAAR
jgi:hypothetical protein